MNKLGIILLAIGTISTGCLNSMFTKYQDNQKVDKIHKFEQPVLQTLQMFIGEMCAFVVIFGRRGTEFRDNLDWKQRVWLGIPALCDVLGTTLMHLGLIYTPVSIYQMVRGVLVLFVGMLSVLFLGRKISRVEWGALCAIVLGITIVGWASSTPGDSDAASNSSSGERVLFGIGLILAAQIFTAGQFVVEEYLLSRFEIESLELVGFEGLFGATITATLMVLGNLVTGNNGGIFDIGNALDQLFGHSAILLSSILIMLSIFSFNFLGISLTKYLSATSRSTIDSCRTLMVWILSMIIGWESFKFGQLVGFVILVCGTLVFNGLEVEWMFSRRGSYQAVN